MGAAAWNGVERRQSHVCAFPGAERRKGPAVHVLHDESAAAARQMDYLAEQLGRLDEAMIDPQEFGALKAEVQAQRRDLDRIAVALEKLAGSVSDLQTTMNEARGGWRAVAFVGGIGATAGGAIAWAVQHIKVA